MSACGWLLTVQTPLKVSFWTGATSAWTFPLCTHSSISFAFRFRALPEPQSAVTVWLSPAVPVYWAGRVRTSLNPMGSQVRNGGISAVFLNAGAKAIAFAAESTLPCSSTQARASSGIAQAVKCGISANIPKRRSILPALLVEPAENAFLLTLAYSRPPRQAKMVDSLQGTQTLLWAAAFQPPSRRTLQSLS